MSSKYFVASRGAKAPRGVRLFDVRFALLLTRQAEALGAIAGGDVARGAVDFQAGDDVGRRHVLPLQGVQAFAAAVAEGEGERLPHLLEVDRAHAAGLSDLKLGLELLAEALQHGQTVVRLAKGQRPIGGRLGAFAQRPLSGEDAAGVRDEHRGKASEVARERVALHVLQLITGRVDGQVIRHAQQVVLRALHLHLVGVGG